jgi:DNA-binding NarL/FixJ family response regulator
MITRSRQEVVSGILYPELVRRISCPGRRGQVLAGMWAGKGTKQIAADLGISPKTVEYHRYVLYGLLGVDNPVTLVRRAIEKGLIKPAIPQEETKATEGEH